MKIKPGSQDLKIKNGEGQPHEKALGEYYKLRKWDNNGIPTPEALKETNLEEYIDILRSN